MTRLAAILFLAADVTLVAGVAGARTGLVVLSAMLAAAMLAVLLVNDRNESRPSLPTQSATFRTGTRSVDEAGTVRVDAIAIEDGVGVARSTPRSAVAVLENDALADVLARVSGLGPRKVEALTEAFGSTSALRSATKGDLLQVPGIGSAIADRVLAELR